MRFAANAVFMPRFSIVSSRCSPLPLGSKPGSSSTRKSSGVLRILAARTASPWAWGKVWCSSTFVSSALSALIPYAARSARTSNTAACAAIPSPRPVKPSFSLVVALTLTASRSIPRSAASRSRIAGACGPTLGRSQTTVMSALPTRQPRSPINSLHRRRKARLSAPFHRASLGGKCWPISPNASAPSMASHSAWMATSPSECATTPWSCGTRTPPSMTWSPSPKAWTSKPWPMRMFISTTGQWQWTTSFAFPLTRLAQQELYQREVRRRGDLDVVLAPFHQAGSEAGPFHRHRLVGHDDAVGACAFQRRRQGTTPECLRRERAPQSLSRLGGGYVALRIGALERVAYRRGQDGAIRMRVGGRDQAIDITQAQVWPRRIMYQHQCGVGDTGWQGLQCGEHGIRAFAAAVAAQHRLAPQGFPIRPTRIVGRQRHHGTGDARVGQQDFQRVRDQRPARNSPVLLGDIAAKAAAASGRGDDHPDGIRGARRGHCFGSEGVASSSVAVAPSGSTTR